MKSRDACSLKSLYQEWEERQMAAMKSSTESTSKTPKVKAYTSLLKWILTHHFLFFLVIHLAKGYFDTYDLAKRDAEGNYQVTGRVDDAIRIKGVWLEVPKIEGVMVRKCQ